MLEYIIIGLLIVCIILIIILLTRKSNHYEIIEKLGKFETDITKEIGEFKFNFSRDLTGDFEKLNMNIERKLSYINDTVNERLDKNFEKSNKTFMNVLERLSKIDEAQKKIDDLSGDIISLQSVLTDKKTRGTFGEVNLEYILNNAFGSSSNGIYQTQYKFDNGILLMRFYLLHLRSELFQLIVSFL